MGRLERFVSISLLAFSGVYLAESLTLGLGNSKLPGPGFLPTIIGIFLSSLISLHLMTGFFKRRSLEEKKETLPRGKDLVRILEMLILLGFCGIFIGKLGYIVTIVILVGASLHFLGMRGWVKIALISILTSVASYYFFWVMFDVPLPQGILSF